MADEEPKIARKQLFSKEEGKGSSPGKIKISSDKEKTVKTVVYLISALLGISLLLMALASCPVEPLGKVKEEYELQYPFLSDEDKRLEMREGFMDLELSVNTSSLTAGA